MTESFTIDDFRFGGVFILDEQDALVRVELPIIGPGDIRLGHYQRVRVSLRGYRESGDDVLPLTRPVGPAIGQLERMVNKCLEDDGFRPSYSIWTGDGYDWYVEPQPRASVTSAEVTFPESSDEEAKEREESLATAFRNLTRVVTFLTESDRLLVLETSMDELRRHNYETPDEIRQATVSLAARIVTSAYRDRVERRELLLSRRDVILTFVTGAAGAMVWLLTVVLAVIQIAGGNPLGLILLLFAIAVAGVVGGLARVAGGKRRLP